MFAAGDDSCMRCIDPPPQEEVAYIHVVSTAPCTPCSIDLLHIRCARAHGHQILVGPGPPILVSTI